MKVMIVDSDWRFAQQATGYLESRAHLVVHQPRAKDVLAHVQHWQADLLILSADQCQGVLLKSLMSMKDRPAVLLTGQLDQYDRVWRAWQTGGDEVLIKPTLSSSEFQAAVTMALENRVLGTRVRKVRASA